MNETDRVAYKKKKSISYRSGNWKSKIRVPGWLSEGPLLVKDFLLCPHMVEGTRNFIHEASSLDLIHLSKLLPPNSIAFDIKFSTYEFQGETNI